MRRRGTRRLAAACLAAGAFACAGYAFTASNTVPATQAGSGTGGISGYSASGISYTLDPTTPTNIDQVAFAISPANGTVKVQLAPSGSWYSCANAAGSVTCDTTSPPATVSAATSLTVVAAQ